MITIGPEPEGQLLKRADIFVWVRGLSVAQWKKLRPHLEAVLITGCTRPYYRKSEVKTKLVEPIQKETHEQKR